MDDEGDEGDEGDDEEEDEEGEITDLSDEDFEVAGKLPTRALPHAFSNPIKKLNFQDLLSKSRRAQKASEPMGAEVGEERDEEEREEVCSFDSNEEDIVGDMAGSSVVRAAVSVPEAAQPGLARDSSVPCSGPPPPPSASSGAPDIPAPTVPTAPSVPSAPCLTFEDFDFLCDLPLSQLIPEAFARPPVPPRTSITATTSALQSSPHHPQPL